MAHRTKAKQASPKAQSNAQQHALFSATLPSRRVGQPLDMALLLALGSMAAMPVVHADSFVIVNGQTVTETKVLGAGETGTVETGGTISTTGGFTFGIITNGGNATISNSGTINTAGRNAVGIESTSDNDTVANSGTINTTGSDAYGIHTTSGNAMLTNRGTISTTGSGAFGIFSSGNSATLTNSATISTMGEESYGIYSEGNGATLTNSGTIHTEGRNAVGIASQSENATITNTGKISTKGSYAAGIYSVGDSATLINSGTISTTGISAFGIHSEGGGATITNSGDISTEGFGTGGIRSAGANATLINSGTISTTLDKATGIASFADSAAITNSGTIRTMGVSAYGIGISLTAASASITNSGTISTTGNSAGGIIAVGDSATITNSGLISATGSGSFAIFGGDGNKQTLNLLPGSRIVGAIDLGGGGDTVNIMGSYGSAVLSFANIGTINVLTPNAVRLGTSNTVVVIDPTGESSRAQTLTALSTGIHNVISQRQQSVSAMRPVKLAALELTPDLLNLDTAPVAWGQVFGSQSRRGSDGQLLDFTHRYAGLIGGYEQPYHGDRVGIVAGIANGNTSSAMTSLKSDSVFAGLYRHTQQGEFKLTGSLVAGVESHTSRRTVLNNLLGYETASGTTTSYYLSPSVSVARSYAVSPDWVLRPSAVLGYSVGWYGGYTESGTTNANLSLSSRTVQSVTGRAQLEMARQMDWGEASVRAGVQTRQTSQGAIQGTVGGSDFRFGAVGSKNVVGGFVGLGMRQALRDRLSLIADVEYGQLSGKETQISAQVTLQYVF